MGEAGMKDKPLAPRGQVCGKRREDELVFPHHGKGRAFLSLRRAPQLFGLSIYSSVPNRPQLSKALIAGSLKLSPCKPAWLRTLAAITTPTHLFLATNPKSRAKRISTSFLVYCHKPAL